jgi:hypothetical protein
MTEGKTALMTVDVWEHAYYVDYRNARPKYLEEIWKQDQLGLRRANYARVQALSTGASQPPSRDRRTAAACYF